MSPREQLQNERSSIPVGHGLDVSTKLISDCIASGDAIQLNGDINNTFVIPPVDKARGSISNMGKFQHELFLLLFWKPLCRQQ